MPCVRQSEDSHGPILDESETICVRYCDEQLHVLLDKPSLMHEKLRCAAFYNQPRCSAEELCYVSCDVQPLACASSNDTQCWMSANPSDDWVSMLHGLMLMRAAMCSQALLSMLMMC